MSRLLVKMQPDLQANKGIKVQQWHNKQLQGLIYSLTTGSEFGDMHDQRGCKFFAFSSIFPHVGLGYDGLKNLLVSSPDSELIAYLKRQFDYLKEIKLGLTRLRIVDTRTFDVKLPEDEEFSFITSSPIVARIPTEDNPSKQKCWTTSDPIDQLMNHLEENLFRKYEQFYNRKLERTKIFHASRLIKQVYHKCFMNKQSKFKSLIVGTQWKFKFFESNPLLQFALDTGLGELNSMGYGFVNAVDVNGETLK